MSILEKLSTYEPNQLGGFPGARDIKIFPLQPNTTNAGKAFKHLRRVATDFGSGPLNPDALNERFGNIVQIYLDRMLVQK